MDRNPSYGWLDHAFDTLLESENISNIETTAELARATRVTAAARDRVTAQTVGVGVSNVHGVPFRAALFGQRISQIIEFFAFDQFLRVTPVLPTINLYVLHAHMVL